jgi:hypothetical protein
MCALGAEGVAHQDQAGSQYLSTALHGENPTCTVALLRFSKAKTVIDGNVSKIIEVSRNTTTK